VTKAAPNPDPVYQARLACYRRLAAGLPEAEIKGAANPYTSLNGHMFSYLHPSGALALRLPAGEREAFLKRFQTKLFEAYGVVQTEYVTVPDDLLPETAELAPYFRAGFDYVAAMKPKPAKKAKA
jgi:hypothetical protein